MADNPSSSAEQPKRNRMVDSVGDKAQQVLKEDYQKAKVAALEAYKSRAYLYPIKGILYFLSHRDLWKPFVSRLGPYLILSVSVVAGMFTFTYVPQLALLVFVNGPLAVFSTVLLVLNESSTIINNLARNWLLEDAILDTFDGTLVSRGSTELVKEGREIKPGNNPMSKLGKILKNPFQKFGPKAIIRYLVYLPLNLIPIVGTVGFVLAQSRDRGQSVHNRYFQLKNWPSSRTSDWLKKNAAPYASFGIVATLLEMIPLASMFFTYTNTVGAALWAADIESLNTTMTDETAPALRNAAKDME